MSYEEEKQACRVILYRCIEDTHCVIVREIEKIRKKGNLLKFPDQSIKSQRDGHVKYDHQNGSNNAY